MQQDRTPRPAYTELRLRNGRSLPTEFIARLKSSGLNIKSEETHDTERRRETEFAYLSDGTLLDLVRGRSGELAFALFKDGLTSVQNTVKNMDVNLVTPEAHPSFARAIRFPMEIGASVTAKKLVHEMESVIDLYFDCNPEDRKLLSHFALYSWISDLVPVAPYIWIVGPYCSGKTTLLRIMSALCRRPILVSDLSMAALYEITTAFHPTLLIDEFEPGKDRSSRDFMRILRAGSTMDQKVLRASRVYDPFGPKIVASRVGPADPALCSRGLYVVARPSSRPVAVLSPSALESIAAELQPKLAAFRLHNYERLKTASASLSLCTKFSPRVQDIARALALPVTGEADLNDQLLTVIEAQDQQARLGRDGESDWLVAIALLYLAHVRGPGAPAYWTAKALTEQVHALAIKRGESCTLNPRKVGEILRSLGLRTKRLGSYGRGLRNSTELRDRIHQIAKSLGVCAGDLIMPEYADGPVSCASCERNGLNVDNGGRKMPYMAFSMGPEDPQNPTTDR